MAIYFLRHVKSINNKEKILSGRCEVDVLPEQNIIGINDGLYFDEVYCSTSIRCKKTMELMPNNLFRNVYYTDELLERSLGIIEGIPKKKAIERYPQFFVEGRIGINVEIPDGETIEDVKNRVNLFLQKIISDNKKNYLICSHNQTLKVIYAILKNIEITDDYWRNIDFLNGTIICV